MQLIKNNQLQISKLVFTLIHCYQTIEWNLTISYTYTLGPHMKRIVMRTWGWALGIVWTIIGWPLFLIKSASYVLETSSAAPVPWSHISKKVKNSSEPVGWCYLVSSSCTSISRWEEITIPIKAALLTRPEEPKKRISALTLNPKCHICCQLPNVSSYRLVVFCL